MFCQCFSKRDDGGLLDTAEMPIPMVSILQLTLPTKFDIVGPTNARLQMDHIDEMSAVVHRGAVSEGPKHFAARRAAASQAKTTAVPD